MGIFDKLKAALGGGENKPQNNPPAKEDNKHYESIIDAAHKELLANKNTYWWSIKPSALDAYKNGLLALEDKQKVGFLIWTVKQISSFHKHTSSYNSNETGYQKLQLAEIFHSTLMRTKIIFDEEDVEQLMHTYSTHSRYSSHNLMHWPVNLFVSQVEKQFSKKQLSPGMISLLQQLHTVVQGATEYHQQKRTAKGFTKN